MSDTHSSYARSDSFARSDAVPDHGLDEISATADWALAEKEQHRGTDFLLNRAFVEGVDPSLVEGLLAALRDVGREFHQHGREATRVALAARLDTIGLSVHPVELDKFAEEISRSEWVDAHSGALPSSRTSPVDRR